LKEEKNPEETVVILLVLKLHSGKLVRAPFGLKLRKNQSHTEVMLFVLKLQLGRLVKDPPLLK